MFRYWLAAIGGGAVSALIYTFAEFGTFGALLFAYFAPLPLYLVGFSLGLTASAVASAAATVAMIVVGGFMAAMIFVLVNAIPTIVLIRQALLSRDDEKGQKAWYPAGLLVVTTCVTGAVLYTLTAIFLAMQPAGFEGSVQAFVENLATQMIPQEAAARRPEVVQLVTPMLPGFVTASWLVMVVINATLSQGLLVRFGRNMRPSPDIVAMAFPNWFPMAAAAAALVGLLLPGSLGFYGVNLAMILILPFFFMGLAVVHAMCRTKSAGAFMLTAFYGLLIILGWPVLFVAVLGLIEQWVELRRRFA